MKNFFNHNLYDTQVDFINKAVDVIKNKEIGIFSSPTGTGKTVSLLSSVLNVIEEKEDDLFDILNDNSTSTVYYCSRTHSQLQQVIHEFNKANTNLKAIILGSRKIYCINNKVNTPNTDIETINSRCRDAIKNNKCQYFEKRPSEIYQKDNLDISQLKILGNKECFCPYFYSRTKASACDIVLLPYNLIFTKEGRESINLESLDGKILILDEAHNIISTIIQLNTAEIYYQDLTRIMLCRGIKSEISKIIKKLLLFKSKEERIYKVCDFILSAGLANINTLEIHEYLTKNKIAQKNDENIIFEFSRFLKLLVWSDREAIVLVNSYRIKFTPLSPKLYIENILKSDSIILAGGTMEPAENLLMLFDNRAKYFSFPSISSDFLPIILYESINGTKITLNYNSRSTYFDEALSTVIELSNQIIRGGVVVFVPSKYYLEAFKSSNKLDKFQKKVLFDDTFDLDDFSKEPGIFVTVLGGKYSEGINFSDNSCRLLIVLGVPFPTNDSELKARTQYQKNYPIVCAMNMVNQALGRSLRHMNDYSSMVLFDFRYLQLKRYISPWISKKIKECKYPECVDLIKNFLNR